MEDPSNYKSSKIDRVNDKIVSFPTYLIKNFTNIVGIFEILIYVQLAFNSFF